MANHTIHYWYDNLVVVIVNSLMSGSPQVMGLVQEFTLLCLQLNILFLAIHVPAASNGVTDALSHQKMWRFRELAPDANPSLVRMPPNLWSIGN